MSLDDIKKAILTEAKNKAKEIEQDGMRKAADIQIEWDKKLAEKKQEIIASAQRKANQKVQQTQFKLQSQAQTEILNKKQQIIDRAYKAALQKISSLEDDKYTELMMKLIDQLPEGEGKLISVKGKEDLLKKALRKSKKKFEISAETTNGNGGFIFQSKEVEIDNTFGALIKNAKEETILSVTNLLFGQQAE